MNNHLHYAIHRRDDVMVSRLGNELAWPLLDYAAIGQNGDFRAPLKFALKKVSVNSIGANNEWAMLVWTRYVPTSIKNEHRKFWGFKPLRIEPLPRSLGELCKRHKTRFYYLRQTDMGPLIGIRHGNWGTYVALYHWFAPTVDGYMYWYVSDSAFDEYHHDAEKHEIRVHPRQLSRSRRQLTLR